MWHPNYAFPDYLKTAKSSDRVDYFSEGFLLEHYLLADTRRRIMRHLKNKNGKRIINVVGPTGIGKTALSNDILKNFFLLASSMQQE